MGRATAGDRYWISSAAEAVLRSARQEDHVDMAEMGLVENVLHELVHDGFHVNTTMQAHFDLLSEMVRFSWPVYERILLCLDETTVSRREARAGGGGSGARMRFFEADRDVSADATTTASSLRVMRANYRRSACTA